MHELHLQEEGEGELLLASSAIGPTHNTPSAKPMDVWPSLCVCSFVFDFTDRLGGGVAEAERGCLRSRGMLG